MAKCPNCKSPLYVHKCMQCLHSATPKVKKGVQPCEWPCTATVHVQESLTGRPIQGIRTAVDGKAQATDANGFRVSEKLAPGKHAAIISLEGMADRYARPIGQDEAGVEKSIGAGENVFFTFLLDPLRPLKVVVKRRHDSNGVKGAKLTIAAGKTDNPIATKVQTTPDGGEVTFTRLRQDTYKLQLELDDTGKTKFQPELDEDHHVLDMELNPNEHVFWVRLVIHLKLKYKDPDDTVRHFPKDFPVTVAFDNGSTQDLKVLDDAGAIKFEVDDPAKKKFTLKFDSASTRYLVHEEGKPNAELKTDPSDDDLHKLGDAGKQFFALPKTWALAQSAWEATDVVLPADGQIVIPAEGIGSSAAPAVLTLKPKLQYVRFEFFDRKYGHDEHAKKPVGIPAVVLKAVRESGADGAPVAPLAGTHDTVSNWMVDKADNAKACQCLPWIITKTTAGADLPKFNNKLMFEFGRENAFVHSTGAAARKIVVLPANDPKRKPGIERNQYYDLPKQWKSKCYFTRFSDKLKNKFFDELAAVDDADLEAASSKAAMLTFSLDDVVLVSGASQAIKDKPATTGDGPGGTLALSEHSRITMLTIDRTDKKFKVVVHDPQPTAVYWSKHAFRKEAATTAHRNVIVEYPVNPRAIVFCSDFYDIYDKRTETADFSKKELLGARAAKFEDTDISSRKTILSGDASVTNAYVGYRSDTPRIHYLHYCDLDGATMYGAIIGYWTARFVIFGGGGATDADLSTYRDKGMALAMKRWNEKDYYFEENDDKTQLRVKHFCLFEAKGVETAPGTFTDTGGKHVCQVRVRDNNAGSAAAADGSYMRMRIGGAQDEGEEWGDDPSTLPHIDAFEGRNAQPKCAFAHELGHSALILYDSYLTSYGKLRETGNKDNVLSTKLCGYENHYAGKKDGQEYLGMPYAQDTGAMMFENRADTRLRYLWLRANWLNDQAKVGGADKLPEFLGARRFRVAYEAAGKPKLKYHREDTDRNIYKPSHTGANYALDRRGKCDLHLYRLGDDEYARILRGGPYKGILVVAIKIFVKFESRMTWAKPAAYFVGDFVEHSGSFYTCKTEHTNKDFDAVNDWTAVAAWVANQAYVVGDKVTHGGKCYRCKSNVAGQAAFAVSTKWAEFPVALTETQQIRQIETLQGRINEMLTHNVAVGAVGKFKLYGGGEFSPSLVRVFPQWSHATDPGGSHITLAYSPESKAFQPSGTTINAGVTGSADSIVRYLFGKLGDDPTKWATEGLTGVLVRADFGKLSDWMNSNSGGGGFIVADNA